MSDRQKKFEALADFVEKLRSADDETGLDLIEALQTCRYRIPEPEDIRQVTGSEPVGGVLMPAALTAENGAKYHLCGEFKETITLRCPDCDGGEYQDQSTDRCGTCDDSGDIEQPVTIEWSTIKEIYARAVQVLGTQPQPTKAVPKKITVSQCVSSQYCQGYNDAIDAMLKGEEGES